MMENNSDEYYMSLALAEAEKCGRLGEVPVGALLVKNGEILASAGNYREGGRSAIEHAEIAAIREGCRKLGGWRLHGCTLYVTLEPCPMCAGAIINSRITRVVYGAKDARAGAFGSVMNLNSYPLNHKVELVSGCLGERSAALLRSFFRLKRDAQLK